MAIGRAESSATCDALGFGVGVGFIAEITEKRPGPAPPDGGPWMQVCDGDLFTGPMTVESEWTFAVREDGGASIWGGTFTARLGEACSGLLVVNVDAAESDFLRVRFVPETGEACPERCESRHSATIQILGAEEGPGGGSGGSVAGSGGVTTGVGGAATGGADSGGVSAGGGALSSGGSGGMTGLDPGLTQRMQSLCDADCSNFEEVKQCRPTSGTNQEECRTKCYSAMSNTFHALCPDEFMDVLECAEAHPGALDYFCDGTELVAVDQSCIELAATMRACAAARQGQ